MFFFFHGLLQSHSRFLQTQTMGEPGPQPLAAPGRVSNAVLEMQSIWGEHTLPHAPTNLARALSAPTIPMAQVHPWAGGLESHILTAGSVATGPQPSFWRLSHCTGGRVMRGGTSHSLQVWLLLRGWGREGQNIVGRGSWPSLSV